MQPAEPITIRHDYRNINGPRNRFAGLTIEFHSHDSESLLFTTHDKEFEISHFFAAVMKGIGKSASTDQGALIGLRIHIAEARIHPIDSLPEDFATCAKQIFSLYLDSIT